jgi:hypothetical protein
MLNRCYCAVLSLVLLSASASAAPTEDDVATLAEYLTGAFDSEAQNSKEAAAGLPEAERHTRVTMFHRPVELPAFGAYVFYNQEYRTGDPTKIIRQRLVTLELDVAVDAIRMKQYFFHDPSGFTGAHLAPEKLSDLTSEDVWLLPGCDVFWQRSDNIFLGGMAEGTCVFAFPEGARQKTVIYNVLLDGNRFWRTDRSVFTDTDDVSGGRADDLPTIHQRISAPW